MLASQMLVGQSRKGVFERSWQTDHSRWRNQLKHSGSNSWFLNGFSMIMFTSIQTLEAKTTWGEIPTRVANSPCTSAATAFCAGNDAGLGALFEAVALGLKSRIFLFHHLLRLLIRPACKLSLSLRATRSALGRVSPPTVKDLFFWFNSGIESFWQEWWQDGNI